MADNKPQDDLSIEEILGSIRRIIAEDDEGEGELHPESSEETEDEEPLELTNKIDPEDGTILDVNEQVEYIAPAPLGVEAPEPEQINFVDQKPELQPEAETRPELVPEEKFILLEEESDSMVLQDEDMTPPEALVSTSTAEATSAVMAKLARHTAIMEEGSASGSTIEGMVREILKPMLKSWLDDNLPGIVQKMVEREIERLTKHL